jgi:hypothetical protein
MTAASAPYSTGPSSRAARIVNPYVPRFITPMATAITPLPSSHAGRARCRLPGMSRPLHEVIPPGPTVLDEG